jgi:allophanate hydrolase subunit 2
LLLGNPEFAGALECAVAPARFVVEQQCSIVVGGAPVEVRIDGRRRPRWEVLAVAPGSRMELRPMGVGCRSYLCVAGGLAAAQQQQGAWSVDQPGSGVDPKPGLVPVRWDRSWEPDPGILRIVPGPEFCSGAETRFKKDRWIVSRQSSGMGIVLEGNPLVLETHDLLSAPVQDGTVQATAGGLIALLRQRGTLGGYPRVATVIDCDVDRLAQMLPGNNLRFKLVSYKEARRLCDLQAEALRQALYR